METEQSSSQVFLLRRLQVFLNTNSVQLIHSSEICSQALPLYVCVSLWTRVAVVALLTQYSWHTCGGADSSAQSYRRATHKSRSQENYFLGLVTFNKTVLTLAAAVSYSRFTTSTHSSLLWTWFHLTVWGRKLKHLTEKAKVKVRKRQMCVSELCFLVFPFKLIIC